MSSIFSRIELETEAGMTVGVLTVSDSCFYQNATDRSGANLIALIDERKILPNARVAARACVPDEVTEIKRKLIQVSEKELRNVLLST